MPSQQVAPSGLMNSPNSSSHTPVQSVFAPTYTMTIEQRRDFLFEAERDPEFRALFLQMIDDPDEGDVFFVNTCGWTYDPRQDDDGKIIGPVPFLLWQDQAAAIRRIGKAIDTGRDLGQEKSRDKGLTWLNLYAIAKRWLRRRMFSALVGAITQDLVDDRKSPASLGWKLDFILSYLPDFLKPKGYDEEDQRFRSWASWYNPETESYVNGRAPTARFAVGDRKSCAYYDDWAQWEHGRAAWQSAKASTNCRLASWTVNPEDPLNHAYELRYAKGAFEGVRTDIIKVEELHWTGDPRKQRLAVDIDTGMPYNVWKRDMVGDPQRGIPGAITYTQFLRDYEGVYELASKGRIYGEQMPYAVQGHFPFDPRFPLYTFWDYGGSDDTVIIFAQWDFERYRLRIVDAIARSGHGMEYYVPFVTGRKDAHEILPKEEEYDENDKVAIARRTSWQQWSRSDSRQVVKYLAHYGDPAGKQRSISHNTSAVQILRDAGVEVQCRDDNEGKGFKGRIEWARRILPHCDINEDLCREFISAINTYKWNKDGTKPEHDGASHFAAALEYGCVNIGPMIIESILARKQAAGQSAAQRGSVFGDLDQYKNTWMYEDETTTTGRQTSRGHAGY